MYFIAIVVFIAIVAYIFFISNKKELFEDKINYENYKIFEDYNPLSYRKFIETLKQYNKLKLLNVNFNEVTLKNKIIELFDYMTFHIPYKMINKYAKKHRYYLLEYLLVI